MRFQRIFMSFVIWVFCQWITKQKSSSQPKEASEDDSSAREIFIHQNFQIVVFSWKRANESLGKSFSSIGSARVLYIPLDPSLASIFFINLLLNLLKIYFISNTFGSYEMILSGLASHRLHKEKLFPIDSSVSMNIFVIYYFNYEKSYGTRNWRKVS